MTSMTTTAQQTPANTKNNADAKPTAATSAWGLRLRSALKAGRRLS